MNDKTKTTGGMLGTLFSALLLVLALAGVFQWLYNDVNMADVIGGSDIDYDQSIFVCAVLLWIGV